MKKLALLAGVAALAALPALAQPQPNSGQSTPRTAPSAAAPSAAPSTAAGHASSTRAVSAAEFMRMAEMSDRFEVGSSRLAAERAQKAEVKQFAEAMVRDHTKTTQELTQLRQRMQGATGAQTSGVMPQGTGGSSATPGTSPSTSAAAGAGGTSSSSSSASTRAGSPAASSSPTTGGSSAAAGGTVTTAQGGPQAQGLDAEHQQMMQQLQNARGTEFDRLFMQMQVQAHQKAVDMFTGYSQNGDNAELKRWAAQTLPDLQRHLQQAQQIQRSL